MRTTGGAGDGGTRAAGDGVRTPLCDRTRRRGSGVLAYRAGWAAGEAVWVAGVSRAADGPPNSRGGV